jgi:NAD(P)-dependent dehydrogenase (short-subunit alcohol dehydrogenase family)
MSPFRLDGEVALITGGGTGIGLGIARCMVEAGARAVLIGRREEPLRQAVEELGSACCFEIFDITRLSEAPAVVDRIHKRLGTISILVNNAGIHLKKPAVETTEEEFLNVLNTHLLGAHAMTRAVAPAMLQARKGSILFIASMASLFGIPRVVAYAAAKSAYLGVVRCLATEFSPEGVRVNAIAPGWINSHMLRHLDSDPQRKEKILNRTPMHGFGEPEDIGYAAVYLSSKAGRFVTGAVLPVDGGVSIGF